MLLAFLSGIAAGLLLGCLWFRQFMPKGFFTRQWHLLGCKFDFHQWKRIRKEDWADTYQCRACSLYSRTRHTVHPPKTP